MVRRRNLVQVEQSLQPRYHFCCAISRFRRQRLQLLLLHRHFGLELVTPSSTVRRRLSIELWPRCCRLCPEGCSTLDQISHVRLDVFFVQCHVVVRDTFSGKILTDVLPNVLVSRGAAAATYTAASTAGRWASASRCSLYVIGATRRQMRRLCLLRVLQQEFQSA